MTIMAESWTILQRPRERATAMRRATVMEAGSIDPHADRQPLSEPAGRIIDRAITPSPERPLIHSFVTFR
jgi:hypothetical protein